METIKAILNYQTPAWIDDMADLTINVTPILVVMAVVVAILVK